MSNTDCAVTMPRDGSGPLSRQLAAHLRALIKGGRYAAGQRLPSVRALAASNALSTQTVVEAYAQLMAAGFVVSRRGSGYFAAERGSKPGPALVRMREQLDPRRLGREVLTDTSAIVRLGGGGLSPEWIDHVEIESALRRCARGVLPRFGAYGSTQGYAPLRALLASGLGAKGIQVPASHILMCHGATQAIDLAIRVLTRAEQTVLVDDPGYFQTTWALKVHGAKVVGVPRTDSGPDPQAFERLCVETGAKVFFTQSALHNPTGSMLTLGVAYELLRTAERHGVTIVEDDVSGDLAPDTAPRLAMLDQLQRVLYIGSFSKTLSPSLRVGYLATRREDLLDELTRRKLVSSYVSCEPNESIVHTLMVDGHYARHVRRLERRLKERALQALPALQALGFVPGQNQPSYAGGTSLWLRHRSGADALTLANEAAASGILLAPGCVFRPNEESSQFFRFVLPLCTERAIAALAGVVQAQPGSRVAPPLVG